MLRTSKSRCKPSPPSIPNMLYHLSPGVEQIAVLAVVRNRSSCELFLTDIPGIHTVPGLMVTETLQLLTLFILYFEVLRTWQLAACSIPCFDSACLYAAARVSAAAAAAAATATAATAAAAVAGVGARLRAVML